MENQKLRLLKIVTLAISSVEVGKTKLLRARSGWSGWVTFVATLIRCSSPNFPSPKLCSFKTQNSLWHSSTNLYYTSSKNSKTRKSTKYWKGTDHIDKFLKSESVSKIVVQTHSPANPLNGEPNNRLAEIHESLLLLRLEFGTFDVTGSVKVYMIFQLVPEFRFRSFEMRSFNLCPMPSPAKYDEIFLFIDYLFILVFIWWYVDELGFWLSGEIADINLKITTYKERFYMVLEHDNSGVNAL